MTMQTIEELKNAFEQFKKLNDQRLAEVEKHGAASQAAVEAADRANAAITDLETRLTSLDGVGNRLADLEDRMNRDRMGGRGYRVSDETLERYANWETAIKRKHDDPVDPSDVDLEFVKNYKRDLNTYLGTGRASNEMSVGFDENGGYWVDPDTSGRIVEFIYASSPIRQLTTPQVITSDTYKGETDLGEAEFGWVGEFEPRPETGTPTIAEWEIPLREMYAQPYLTQRIVDFANRDAEAWLATKVQRRFARGEASAFVGANAPKRPRGFLTYPDGVPGNTVATWPVIEQIPSGHASQITADGFIKFVYALKSDFLPSAVVGMNRDTERRIRELKTGDGAYIWQPDFTERRQPRVLGIPVVDLPDMPTVQASALVAVLADFGEAYQIIDSPIGIRVLRDNVTTKGKVKLYTTRYVGGDVVNFEAIKLLKVAAA